MGDNHRGACRRRWLKLAGIEDGTRPGVTAAKSDELRELRERNKLRGSSRR